MRALQLSMLPQLLLALLLPGRPLEARPHDIVEVKPFDLADHDPHAADTAKAAAPHAADTPHATVHHVVNVNHRVEHVPNVAAAPALERAPVRTPPANPGPEEAYRSRCWKAGFSPKDGQPVDHTPGSFLTSAACRGRIYLVSIVHSAIGNRRKRDLIRRTWGSAVNVEGRRLATVFVVGRSVSSQENGQIDEESREYGDMVVANFLDHYRNLTYKNLYGIRWALEHCQGVRFVIKVDDDVLLNPFTLVPYTTDRLSEARNFFYCRTARESKMTNRQMKWYVTPEEWPDAEYPVHCKGLGYLFSADLLRDLHLCAKWRSYFWIDDIFVTGVLGQALGATVLHWAPGWDFQYLQPRHVGPEVNQAILFNDIESNPMSVLTRRAWRAMLVYST